MIIRRRSACPFLGPCTLPIQPTQRPVRTIPFRPSAVASVSARHFAPAHGYPQAIPNAHLRHAHPERDGRLVRKPRNGHGTPAIIPMPAPIGCAPQHRGTNRRLTEKLPAYWKRPGTASGKDAERSAGTPLFSNGAFLAAIRATTGDVSNFRQRPVPKTPSATSASDISGPSAILRRVRPKRGRSHFVRQRLGNNLRSVVVAPHAGDLVERGDDLPRIGQRDQL